MLSCLTNPEEQATIISKIIQVLERDSESQNKSISWHRRLVNLVERSQNTEDQLSIGFYARSYLLIARFEMGDLILNPKEDRVGNATDQQLEEKKSIEGNPHLANDFLQKVVATSPEFVEKAEELLKKLAFMRD